MLRTHVRFCWLEVMFHLQPYHEACQFMASCLTIPVTYNVYHILKHLWSEWLLINLYHTSVHQVHKNETHDEWVSLDWVMFWLWFIIQYCFKGFPTLIQKTVNIISKYLLPIWIVIKHCFKSLSTVTRKVSIQVIMFDTTCHHPVNIMSMYLFNTLDHH